METRETKNCPYCGEEILAVAKKCKHCGEWLDKSSKPNTPVVNRKPNQHDNSNQISQNFQKDEAKQPSVAVQVNSYQNKRKSDNESSFEKGFGGGFGGAFGGVFGGCLALMAILVILTLLSFVYFKSCTPAGSNANSDTPSYYSPENSSDNGDTENNFYEY